MAYCTILLMNTWLNNKPGIFYSAARNGGVAERLNAPVLKTGMSRGIQGSNPCPSANTTTKSIL